MWKLLIGAGVVTALLLGLFFFGGYKPLRFIGEHEIATGDWVYQEAAVGEISGLAYDPVVNVYYAVSDDRGENGPAGRLYTLDVPIDESGPRDVQIYGMTLLDSDLQEPGVQTHARDSFDGEEILLTRQRTFLIASERDENDRPWIREYTETGILLREIELPGQFLGAEGQGVRSNLAIEAMTLEPDGETLFVANEQALEQDGPVSTVEHGTTIRIVQYGLTPTESTIEAQYAYITEPIFASPINGSYADNGVTAMLYVKHLLPRYDLLVVERSYSAGVGNDVQVFGVKLEKADNVAGVDALSYPYGGTAVHKEPLLRISARSELSDIDVEPDNIEAIALGPKLANGNRTLILASDNNFNDSQRNLFLAFEIVP